MLQADWGKDGLFVGIIVNGEKIEVPLSDGKLRSYQSWKVMYADEDHECGEFMIGGKYLRLDDGVNRRIFWFEGDEFGRAIDFRSTYDGRLGLQPGPEKPPKSLPAASAGVAGRTAHSLEASHQSVFKRPLMRPSTGNLGPHAAPMHDKKLMAGRKFNPGNTGQRGMKRASAGGEIPPTKMKTAPCMKAKSAILNTDGSTLKYVPNEDTTEGLQEKQASMR